MTIDNGETEEVEDEYFTSYSNDDIKNILQEAGYSDITIITRNHSDNKRIIKTYKNNESSEEIIDDNYDVKNAPLNQEWTCIIAK